MGGTLEKKEKGPVLSRGKVDWGGRRMRPSSKNESKEGGRAGRGGRGLRSVDDCAHAAAGRENTKGEPRGPGGALKG